MIWLYFAEKEFEPEFEIALSEDLFDRPCFNCSASERIDWMQSDIGRLAPSIGPLHGAGQR
jgi:hypothetical protein